MLNSSNNKIWQDTSTVLDLIRDPQKKITIITHLDPDGDAIGSSLGLMRIFRNIGHCCYVISPNEYPEYLMWMPGNNGITVFDKEPEKASNFISQSEILILVDFNTVTRVKQFSDMVIKSDVYKLMIDHHPDPVFSADCIISDTTVSSTAEIVYQFIMHGGLQKYMDKDVATCLFAGILTDTGCFSYNSSNPDTYKIVAELLDYHIEKDKIYSLVYDNFSGNRMRLLGYCLNEKMKVIPECRTAYIWLSKKELQDYNFQVGDSEGFVNYPLSIKDIRFSAFFIEKEDHIKASFRSKGNFAANRFAEKYFNGGGHMNASGGESYDTMDATLERFKKVLLKHREELMNYEL